MFDLKIRSIRTYNIHLCSTSGFAHVLDRIIRRKLQADAVHTMPLISRCRIPFPFEDMTKVATAVAAHYFRSLHAKCTVCMSRDCAWDGVEICRPAAARLELVIRFVKRHIATGTGVDTRLRHVLVIFASPWRLGTFFSEDSELFCLQKSAGVTAPCVIE